MPSTVTFVTGNANKLKEVQAIMADSAELTNRSLDLDELQGTILEVATAKCKEAAGIIKGPVLVEDTALTFTVYKELPGPYIKWFMESIGHEGLNNMLAAYEDKSAQAICTFAFSEGPGEEVKIFQGVQPGKIVPAKGPTGFGWDPVFLPDGYDQTYAEMPKSLKNTISHRYQALMLLKDFLKSRA
ncbi:inosine triphosphate pyrophosphatase-like protein [Lipomyces oligophaga]|uniref:inosine triphosphate pyrophosphatase-like protein n=1 Tax=Lipomyces oligophaga TaxID=45792 RepID=UPI0034CFFB6A